MNQPSIDQQLASCTEYPHGWSAAIPPEHGTLFGQPVALSFETRLVPAPEPPPEPSADERQTAALLLADLPAVLAEVARQFDAYHSHATAASGSSVSGSGVSPATQALRATIRDPHIWISRELQEDEGPTRWTFVIQFQGSADYALDLQFEGLECIDAAGGD